MSIKHWIQVGGAVACLSLGELAVAAPWLEAGDVRARFALQKLADRGHLNRPATTWPFSWSAFDGGIERSVSADIAAVGMPRAYLQFERGQQGQSGFRAEFSLSGANQESAFAGFEGVEAGEGGASLNLQWQGYALAAGLKVSEVLDPADDEAQRFDGSYLAAKLSNWELGAGAVERWWGPGWQSSLILSNNARPLPAVWLNRADTRAFDSKWLNWIGPWGLTLMAGSYENTRVVPEAKLIGMRFTFRPIEGLDIGLSRAIMFGGRGRPENASTIWNAITGTDNGQLEENDPGNQLGSIDMRYGFAVGKQAMGLYLQMLGEDEAGAFPSRKSWLFGSDWTSQWLNGDQQWFVEYSNTLADDLFGNARPNITYNHSRYRTGYHYYGRSMGSSFDGDAKTVTLGLYHFTRQGSQFSAKISHAELNRQGQASVPLSNRGVFYYVPMQDENTAILDLGYGRQLFKGWLELRAQGTEKKIEFISGIRDQWSVSARWTYRF